MVNLGGARCADVLALCDEVRNIVKQKTGYELEYRHGGAAISEKHCGFVVNLGGARCADVLALCDEVRNIVKQKTGYELEKEVRVVGEV